MDVQRLVLLTLAGSLSAGSLTSCTSVWNCNPGSETFKLDEDVTAATIDEIIEGWSYEDAESIDCSTVCSVKYREAKGWETGNVKACDFELDETVDLDAAEDDDVVGHVTCKGDGYEYMCEGRRPLGHVEDEGPRDSRAAYLSRCAHLEAASVQAFLQLAGQLQRWGAPSALVERCRAAGRDEARHTAAVLSLVPGVSAPVLSQEAIEDDLLQSALHNATEGCVHETWAAMGAVMKAKGAHDPAVRAVYRDIAVDEIRHAQLAWDLHDWFGAMLSDEDRATVQAAQAAALARLPQLAGRQAAMVPAELGLPEPRVACAMAERFAQGLAA